MLKFPNVARLTLKEEMLYFLHGEYMQHTRTTYIIGITEVLIGSITWMATISSLLFSFNHKPGNVLLYVLITATMSTLIGIGILTFNRLAIDLLIYFSSVIVLTKFLMITDIIYLNHAFETFIPPILKNLVSLAYHAFLIYYFTKSDVRHLFADRKYIPLYRL